MANTPLKIAIIQSGKPAYKVEQDLKFWPGKLSKIIAGIIVPTKEERLALAKVLKKEETALFILRQVEAE